MVHEDGTKSGTLSAGKMETDDRQGGELEKLIKEIGKGKDELSIRRGEGGDERGKYWGGGADGAVKWGNEEKEN
jgi:hypothetical protein